MNYHIVHILIDNKLKHGHTVLIMVAILASGD